MTIQEFYSNNSYNGSASFRSLNEIYSRSGFKACNRNNPCLICGSTKGKCSTSKSDPDFLQCHTNQDARKKAVILGNDGNEWICVHETNGFTAGFKPYTPRTEYKTFTKAEKLQWKKEQQKKEQLKREEEAKRIDNELSLSDRQKYFALLAGKSPLTEDHLEELADNRGLSAETIKKIGFFSLKPNHRVDFYNLPANFPGLRKDQTLNVAFTSIAIPVKNSQGDILAVELMPIPKRVSCKYVKLSCSNENAFSGYNSEHYQGELPISASFPSEPNKLDCDVTPVFLIEGRLKPIVAQERHNIAYIAAGGGNFAGSPKGFRSEVEAAIKKYGAIKLVFTPDAGDINNTQLATNRAKQINFINQLASELNISFDVIWWGQDGSKKKSANDKSINDLDIDELNNFDAVNFITTDELLAKWKQPEIKSEVVNLSPNLVNKINSFRSLNEKELNKSEKQSNSRSIVNGSYKTTVRSSAGWRNWIEKNKYTPDVIIKGKGDLVLPDDFDIKDANVFMHSGVGTKKTGAGLDFLKTLREERGVYALIISHLNSILKQSIERAYALELSDKRVYIKGLQSQIEVIKRAITELIDDEALQLNVLHNAKKAVIDVNKEVLDAIEKLENNQATRKDCLLLWLVEIYICLTHIFITVSKKISTSVIFSHIQDDEDAKTVAARDSNSNVASCINSIGYFDGYVSDRVIYTDEIESVMQVLVSGANLGHRQGDTIETAFNAYANSWGNFFTDAYLTDLTAELIEKVTGRKSKKYKYVSDTFRKKRFNFIVTLTKLGTPAFNDPSAILGMIHDDIRAGKNVFLTTDSRLLGEGIADQALSYSKEEIEVNKTINSMKENGYKIQVHEIAQINRNTSGTDEGKKFLSNPGKHITENKIKVVIGTPSMGIGVSVIVPDGYFDSLYTVFCGVLSTKSQRQMLARLRNNSLTHHVYCPINSDLKDRSKPQQYIVTDFLREINQLQQTGRAISDQQIFDLISQAKSRVNPIFDEYSAEMGALDNFEQDNLLECLTYALEDEGHEVTLTFVNHNKEAEEKAREAKKKIQHREAVEFFNDKPFESIEEAKTVTKSNPTPQNHRRKDKTYLLDKLPGITDKSVWNTEFVLNYVIADKEQKDIKSITREFMLKNFDIALDKHNVRMINNAQKEHPVAKDLLPGDFGVIYALKQLKFDERVLNVEQFTCKSPFIQEMIKEYETRKDLQILLKIDVPTKETRDTTIKKFIIPCLIKLGMDTKEVKKIKVDGVQYSAFKAVSKIDEQDRKAIYDCVADKWLKWKDKREIDKKLEEVRVQDELEKQVNELIAEVRKAQELNNTTWESAPLDENVKEVRSWMIGIESQEQHDDLKMIVPEYIWKLTLSTLAENDIDYLANFGSPLIKKGVYDKVKELAR